MMDLKQQEMENTKTQVKNLKKLWKSAPKELMETAPGIINNVTEILTTVGLLVTDIKPLHSIAKHLVDGVHVSPEIANTCLNNCTHPFIEQHKDVLFQSMTSTEACSEAVQQGIQDIMGSAADKILIVGIVSAGICAAIEAYKCYKFWELIKDAKNLVEQSRGQRQKISDQQRDIHILVTKLDKAIADLRKTDISKDDFECAKFAADHFINEIRIKVGEFLNEINNLHVLVNGTKEKLRCARTSSTVSAITGSVSVAAGVTNTIILSAFASPILIGLTAAFTVVNGIIAVANVSLNIISYKQLKELQTEIEEVEKVRNIGLKLQNDANEKSREIITLTMGRNKKFNINKYD